MKLKKLHNNKPFWIGIVLGIIFVIAISTIAMFYIDSRKPTFPKDDIYSYSYGDHIQTNTSYLIAGRYENSSGSHIYDTYLRFENKMKDFSKCEISFYVYEYDTCTSPVRQIGMYINILCIGDWNEDSITKEKVDDMTYPRSSEKRLERRLGEHKYDITELVNGCDDIPFFTLRIFGNGGIGETNYLRFYSKDANVNDEYKPQLIWS